MPISGLPYSRNLNLSYSRLYVSVHPEFSRQAFEVIAHRNLP